MHKMKEQNENRKQNKKKWNYFLFLIKLTGNQLSICLFFIAFFVFFFSLHDRYLQFIKYMILYLFSYLNMKFIERERHNYDVRETCVLYTSFVFLFTFWSELLLTSIGRHGQDEKNEIKTYNFRCNLIKIFILVIRPTGSTLMVLSIAFHFVYF